MIIKENVFVGPYAVIRADEVDASGDMEPIVIGANSNIQDGVVIHSKSGAAVTIGEYTSIAHRSIVHGPCEVGNRVFIGFNSVLFNCHIGDGAVVRHNSVVDGCDLPPGSTSLPPPASTSRAIWTISRGCRWMPPSSPRTWPTPTSIWSKGTGALQRVLSPAVARITTGAQAPVVMTVKRVKRSVKPLS